MTKFALIAFILFTLTACKNSEKPQFDKIVFNTTTCFGLCPVYHLEIDKNKQVKLFAEEVFKGNTDWGSDTSKEGYFEGTASDTSFKKLSDIIKTAGLDTVKYQAVACCDGPVYTIIKYYNNKRTYLRSMSLPAKLDALVDVLYEICQKSPLKRTAKKFKIEDENYIRAEDIKYPPAN